VCVCVRRRAGPAYVYGQLSPRQQLVAVVTLLLHHRITVSPQGSAVTTDSHEMSLY